LARGRRRGLGGCSVRADPRRGGIGARQAHRERLRSEYKRPRQDDRAAPCRKSASVASGRSGCGLRCDHPGHGHPRLKVGVPQTSK
jgi:hypothetical protein